MNEKKVVRILRNPYGRNGLEVRQARHEAADLIEMYLKYLKKLGLEEDFKKSLPRRRD